MTSIMTPPLNNAGLKSVQPNRSQAKQLSELISKDFTSIRKNDATSKKQDLIKFGANEQEDDVQFSELTQKSKLYARQKYQQTRNWLKKKSETQQPEKKNAAIAAGTGIAAGVAAETLIGGLSGGLFGATVAAITGYKMHKHQQQKQAESSDSSS